MKTHKPITNDSLHACTCQLLSHELALQNKLRAATTGLQYSESKQDHVDRQKVTQDHGVM